MKTPNMIKAMAPNAAPTPMPAFAPVESPPLDVVGAELDAEMTELVTDAEGDGMAEDDEGGAARVGIGSPKRFAIVYTGIPLPSAQQASLSPQHHVMEEVLP